MKSNTKPIHCAMDKKKIMESVLSKLPLLVFFKKAKSDTTTAVTTIFISIYTQMDAIEIVKFCLDQTPMRNVKMNNTSKYAMTMSMQMMTEEKKTTIPISKCVLVPILHSFAQKEYVPHIKRRVPMQTRTSGIINVGALKKSEELYVPFSISSRIFEN